MDSKQVEQMYAEASIAGEQLEGNWKMLQDIGPEEPGSPIWQAIVHREGQTRRVVRYKRSLCLKQQDEVDVFQHPQNKSFLIAEPKDSYESDLAPN